jgi:tripartite-type tricarboxylate transporter receptor subunit TctC
MTRLSRRSVAATLAALALPARAWAAGEAEAAGYPLRPVRLVVPYPPGGAVDLTARVLAGAMGEALRQPMVVENRPGANGILGAEAVVRAAPDGHTLLLAPREVFGVNPALYRALPYDPLRGFAHVAIATTGPYVLVVNPSLGVATVAELATLGRGRELSYGSFGIGSMAQLNLEAFARDLGMRMHHVPYRGAPAAVTAVLAGEVALTIATPPSVLDLVRAGRLRALAVGADRRLPQLPEVPTMAEGGLAVNSLAANFFAVAAPAGTPAVIVARLNAEVARAVAQPEVARSLVASGLVPAAGTAEEMARTVAADIARFAALVRAVGIEPQ